MSVSGSVRGFAHDGIPYRVAADANINLNDTTSTESMATSGGNVHKITIEPADAESIKLLLTPSEYETLRTVNRDLDSKTIKYTMADGTEVQSEGRLTLGQYATEDTSCEVTAHSKTGEWEIFAAS